MSYLAIERHQRGIELTWEDSEILSVRMTEYEQYQLSVCERNDYAVMAARSLIARIACRATRDRVMPPV